MSWGGLLYAQNVGKFSKILCLAKWGMKGTKGVGHKSAEYLCVWPHISSSHYIFKILNEPFTAIYFLPHLAFESIFVTGIPVETLISCNIYEIFPAIFLRDDRICNISIWNCTTLVTNSMTYSYDVKICNTNFKIQ